jgi:hypothetical protein
VRQAFPVTKSLVQVKRIGARCPRDVGDGGIPERVPGASPSGAAGPPPAGRVWTAVLSDKPMNGRPAVGQRDDVDQAQADE